MRTLVNDEVRQDDQTSDLVFGITELLVYVTARVEIEGIGALTNPVVDWPTGRD